MVSGRSAFRKSPLSICVPLDGSDIVLGLSELQRRQRFEALEECLRLSKDAESAKRYKGPYIRDLSMESLRNPPTDWQYFLLGLDCGSSPAPYTLPSHMNMLLDRVEENVVFFLVNYLTILAAFLLHICLKHPWIIAAMLCVYLLGPSASIIRQACAVQVQQQVVQIPQLELGMRLLLIFPAYAFYLMSGAAGGLLRCLPVILATLLGHATLRTAASEYKAGGAVGVDFRDLWIWRTEHVRQHVNSFKVFRELWVALVRAVIIAHSLLWDHVRSSLAVARRTKLFHSCSGVIRPGLSTA